MKRRLTVPPTARFSQARGTDQPYDIVAKSSLVPLSHALERFRFGLIRLGEVHRALTG
ncbi:hypothetical protein DHODJN_19485 [Methylorubrum extorquens]